MDIIKEKDLNQIKPENNSPSISSENQVGVNEINKMRAPSSQDKTMSKILPSLSLENEEGYWQVAKEIGKGALNEIVEHPGRVLGNAALGVAAGVGMALAAPEVVVGVTVAGVGLGAYEIYKKGSEWLHSAQVIAKPQGH